MGDVGYRHERQAIQDGRYGGDFHHGGHHKDMVQSPVELDHVWPLWLSKIQHDDG